MDKTAQQHIRLRADADCSYTTFWMAMALRTAPRAVGATGFVYFAEAGGLVKIGFSGAPAVRVRNMRRKTERNTPRGLVTLLAQTPGCMGHEAMLHALFWKQFRQGEWFAPDRDLNEVIEQAKAGMCAEDILLFHIGRRREPFEAPRFGPANRSPYDWEPVETRRGHEYIYDSIPHLKGTYPTVIELPPGVIQQPLPSFYTDAIARAIAAKHPAPASLLKEKA